MESVQQEAPDLILINALNPDWSQGVPEVGWLDFIHKFIGFSVFVEWS